MYNRYGGGGGGGGIGFPGLTPMVQRLMLINGGVFLLQFFTPLGAWITEHGSVRPEAVLAGEIWQPFTYMWLHGGPLHIIFNMFALWMFGGAVEQVWGSRRFLNFYLQCGVGAGVVILVWNFFFARSIPTLGASGAIFGLLTAFSLLWPDRTIMLLIPPMPIKAIWFIPLLFVLQLAGTGGGNISHIGHLGGVLVAGVLMRDHLPQIFNLRSLRYRWHRYRMRNRLRAVRREEWDRQRRDRDDDRPTYH